MAAKCLALLNLLLQVLLGLALYFYQVSFEQGHLIAKIHCAFVLKGVEIFYFQVHWLGKAVRFCRIGRNVISQFPRLSWQRLTWNGQLLSFHN